MGTVNMEREQGMEGWRRNLGRNGELALQGRRETWWWTGPNPEAGHCPGLEHSGRLSSLPAPHLGRCTASSIQAYFDNTWALTEVLFSSLQSAEAFYRPPYHRLRHPLIFYYGHVAALYINKLRVAGLLRAPLNAGFERLFETGVDEMSWDDMSKNDMEWPRLQEVHSYRREVYTTVSQVIAHCLPQQEPGRAVGWDSPEWALLMGMEHERIHLETSSVLIRELPLELVRPPEAWPALHPSAREGSGAERPQAGPHFPVQQWVSCAGGSARLGKPRDFPSYGWDNEYGQRQVQVRPFRAGQRLVSNGEFLEFVLDGGYQSERYWSAQGWPWRQFREARWPTFWVPRQPDAPHSFALRTCFELVDMPWAWPAEVNYHEAKAYCAWRGERDGCHYRLLTEAEHGLMRDGASREERPERDPILRASGPALRGACNLNLAWGSPSPVDAHPPSSEGFQDVAGNSWQWCEDHFNPLEGFEVHRLYDDFSSPCFDGEHQMIVGGSFVSSGGEASVFARFHFRPHFFQHAGLRLVQDEGPGPAVRGKQAGAAAYYDSQEVLAEYLSLHYGSAEDAMPYAFGPREAADFPARCARLALAAARERGVALRRALDVGCNVGGASFELARDCEEVLGVDISASSIEAARRLAREGSLTYRLKVEGELSEERRARVDPALERSRVSFRQADACSLPPELEGFDLVLLCNVLCRLPSPSACLSRMGGPRGLVRPGGLLLITAPYSWMARFTPPGAWLGGRLGERGPERSREALRRLLAPHFELELEQDMPLLIREHERKFQYIVPQASLWRHREE